jgi:hypothetical protein
VLLIGVNFSVVPKVSSFFWGIYSVLLLKLKCFINLKVMAASKKKYYFHGAIAHED